ncbi:hypothetical protein FRB96_002657 [Tulasnella sp. 330]|nr:hypothetical protein FRB96_002657 [Tulasnella sp. 330]
MLAQYQTSAPESSELPTLEVIRALQASQPSRPPAVDFTTPGTGRAVTTANLAALEAEDSDASSVPDLFTASGSSNGVSERGERDPAMPHLEVIRARQRARTGLHDEDMPEPLSVSASSNGEDWRIRDETLSAPSPAPNSESRNGILGADWAAAELARLNISFNLHNDSLRSRGDSNRARLLLDNMTVLPPDTLERYIRVCSLQSRPDEPEGQDTQAAVDEVACTVCWESLLQTGGGVSLWSNTHSIGVEGMASDSAAALHQVVALPCTHVFHSACLEPWLQNKTTCPQCRFQLDPTRTTRLVSTATTDGTGWRLVNVPTRGQPEPVETVSEIISPFNRDDLISVPIIPETTLGQRQTQNEAPTNQLAAAQTAVSGSSTSLSAEPAVFADFSSLLSSSSTSIPGNLFEGLAASTDGEANGAAFPEEWAAVSVPASHGDALAELSFSFNDLMEDHPDLFPHSFSRSESASPLSVESEDDEEREPEGPAVTLAGPTVVASDSSYRPSAVPSTNSVTPLTGSGPMISFASPVYTSSAMIDLRDQAWRSHINQDETRTIPEPVRVGHLNTNAAQRARQSPRPEIYIPPKGVMTFEEMLVKREVQEGLRCRACSTLLDTVGATWHKY